MYDNVGCKLSQEKHNKLGGKRFLNLLNAEPYNSSSSKNNLVGKALLCVVLLTNKRYNLAVQACID